MSFKRVKVTVALHGAAECHLPSGITQCYLQPNHKFFLFWVIQWVQEYKILCCFFVIVIVIIVQLAPFQCLLPITSRVVSPVPARWLYWLLWMHSPNPGLPGKWLLKWSVCCVVWCCIWCCIWDVTLCSICNVTQFRISVWSWNDEALWELLEPLSLCNIHQSLTYF